MPEADLQKLKSSGAIRGDNPWGLLRNVWFHINLYWCRRGREGQRELTKQSFQFLMDESGREYVSMTHDEATKNHPGGIDDVSSVEKEARMCSTSDDQLFDGLNCLKMYLQKLNPRCEALFQYPKRAVTKEDQVWYDNKPLGVNKLAGMMKEISKRLCQKFTPIIVSIIVSERLRSRCGPTGKFHRGTSWRSPAIAVKQASETTTPALRVNN